MRTILSVEALSRQLSGIGRYTWELASRLPALLAPDAVQFHHQQRWVNNPALLLQELTEDAFLFPPKSIPWGLRRLYKKLNRPNWKRDCRDAVFHGPNFFVPEYADKAIATIHDLSVFKYPETHPAERIKQFEQHFSRSLEKASLLITDSQATRREVMEYCAWPENKIFAIPLAADEHYHPRSAESVQPVLSTYGLHADGYCLCVATLEPRKNISNLIEAYSGLPQALRMRYPLVLVGGRGWLSEPIHQKIERLKSEGWLKYLGYVPQADIPSLYAGARSFAYPSFYEGFGLPVLEAMASGVPVVASNRTSLPEVTQGQALHVEPEDVDALRQALAKCLQDNQWRALIIEKGLEVAGRYSWDRCVHETVAVYQQING